MQHFGFVEKLIGEDSLQTIHPDDRNICIAAVEYCLTHPGAMKQIVMRKPCADGTYLETEWEFIAVCDAGGVPYEMQCVGRDITDRKAAERQAEELNRELSELNKHLEHRVLERTQELSALSREKDEFIGIAAHDLKNPLAAIKLSAERILMQCERGTLANIAGIAHTIDLASERMLEIISNLLDTNKLESGQLSIKPEWCTSALVEAIVQQYQDRALEKGITLLYDCPRQTTMYADKHALQQIVDNLVSNAIKYSPQWKSVQIRLLQMTTTENRFITRLEVQDEGPGLSEEDHKQLFTKFSRLSARPTAGEHSTGLGLSIVKKLVDLHGGRVWCQSEYGHGATFVVEFPHTPSPTL